MVAHMTNLTGGTLEYVNMFILNTTSNMYYLGGSATFSPRQGCGYEYYSQNFGCPDFHFALAVLLT